MTFYIVKKITQDKLYGVYGESKEDIERKVKNFLLKSYKCAHRREMASEYKKGVCTYSESYNFFIEEFKNQNITIHFNYCVFDGIREIILDKTETVFLEESRLIS